MLSIVEDFIIVWSHKGRLWNCIRKSQCRGNNFLVAIFLLLITVNHIFQATDEFSYIFRAKQTFLDLEKEKEWLGLGASCFCSTGKIRWHLKFLYYLPFFPTLPSPLFKDKLHILSAKFWGGHCWIEGVASVDEVICNEHWTIDKFLFMATVFLCI